jgi:hypothetical protein
VRGALDALELSCRLHLAALRDLLEKSLILCFSKLVRKVSWWQLGGVLGPNPRHPLQRLEGPGAVKSHYTEVRLVDGVVDQQALLGTDRQHVPLNLGVVQRVDGARTGTAALAVCSHRACLTPARKGM